MEESRRCGALPVDLVRSFAQGPEGKIWSAKVYARKPV
jgi:hypothetical protein